MILPPVMIENLPLIKKNEKQFVTEPEPLKGPDSFMKRKKL